MENERKEKKNCEINLQQFIHTSLNENRIIICRRRNQINTTMYVISDRSNNYRRSHQ